MSAIAIEDVKERWDELIAEVREGGEFVIVAEGRQVARLVPVAADLQPGFARGRIWMADDFDAPLDDFKDYMP